ncbi:MAG: HemK/PrmC family methyltransferase [Candidatus Nealsonbacteria bacterium]
MKLISQQERFYWTRHVRDKMRYYRLSENRLKRVLRNPDRKELGIAPKTVAVMEKTGTKKHPTEIWLMYQKYKRITKIITAWRYPGISPKRQPPPIPEDILWELKHDFKADIPEEYTKGRVKFLNCEIDLSKKVFIPRIETEFWVKKAIKEIKQTKDLKVLDMFAGSGCIGVAVLKKIKTSSVDFSDIDKKALEQIRINLKLNKVLSQRYEIYQSDLFKGLKNKKYAYIFANPPYVAKQRTDEVGDSVLEYEPQKALFSGQKGLNHIRKFLGLARIFLKKQGVIYLEFDPQQKSAIEKILREEGYSRFRFFKDQFKKYRFARVKK